MTEALDFKLRSIESITHGILGIADPFNRCLRNTFGDNGAMPTWFWPTACAIQAVVACLNVSSNNDTVILTLQAYIATFHSGAILYHRVLGHHPASGILPGFFVVVALVVSTIRVGFWVALFGVVVCVIVARCLCWALMAPPEYEGEQSVLIS